MFQIVIAITIITIILILIIVIYSEEITTEFFKLKIKTKELFTNARKFRAPSSMTTLRKFRSSISTSAPIGTNAPVDLSFLEKIPQEPTEYLGNVLSFPDYFNCSEKWVGCLPRAMNQVNCGSCWAFAAVTALSARFYIGSCGMSGCSNYPQINFESMNNVHENINDAYKFRLLYLTDVFKGIDFNDDQKITKEEWTSGVMNYFKIVNDPKTTVQELNDCYQILIYILDYQSLGSIDLSSKEAVIERAYKAFDIWAKLTEHKSIISQKQSRIYDSVSPVETGTINLQVLLEYWANSPITLSAEKLITCCSECVELDFLGDKSKRGKDNPACLGSTLDDAWTALRSNGVPTASCIGYTLDSWDEGLVTPSCRETQGPLYGFCSGPSIRRSSKSSDFLTKINDTIDKIENSGIDPIAMPFVDKNIWTEPQLFRFRAKNVYNVSNNARAIQEEIMKRGPVTTGFSVYPDFQYEFGTDGLGGQFYTSGNPVGSSKNSLIYKWNGIGNDLGGHAIVIVGWGTFKWENYLIPYWTCLNSWGTEWGHSGVPPEDNRTGTPDSINGGYFWILRSINECDIENNVVCGEPDLENITYPGIVQKYGWNVASPSTTDKNIQFVEQNFKPIELDPDNSIIFKKATAGSGSYPDRIEKDGKFEWMINYMKAPSPYTLFWSEPRPTYKIGNLMAGLSPDPFVTELSVSNDTLLILQKVTQVQKNPLLTIDDEQLQYLSTSGTSIKVYRAVNNSKLSGHPGGSIIKIVPFQELSVEFLDSLQLGR